MMMMTDFWVYLYDCEMKKSHLFDDGYLPRLQYPHKNVQFHAWLFPKTTLILGLYSSGTHLNLKNGCVTDAKT